MFDIRFGLTKDELKGLLKGYPIKVIIADGVVEIFLNE